MNALDRKLVEMGLMEAEPGRFEAFLAHLKVFVAKNGHLAVPSEHICSDGYKLGQSVSHIRTGNHKITEEQRAELDALGFIWNASTTGAWWPEFLRHLKAFHVEHDHCRMHRALQYKGYNLGRRVAHIRQGTMKVTEEQRAELDALGFIWDASRIGVWWPEFLRHLKAYKAEHLHCRVKQTHRCSDGCKLGRKVAAIRSGGLRITEGQRTELDALGFLWAGNHGGDWWYPGFLKHLHEFKAANGHCRVPVDYTCPDGYRLGLLTRSLRSGAEIYPVTGAQRAELDALGFIWSARDWYPEFIMHLRLFHAKYGTCEVTIRHICSDGYKLGMRASGVRSGRLYATEEQRAELDALDFVWGSKRAPRP